MDIMGRPALEDLIRYDMESSAYRSADDNVEHALSLLQANETWFAEHRAESLEISASEDWQIPSAQTN
jgi:hypothetical protein